MRILFALLASLLLLLACLADDPRVASGDQPVALADATLYAVHFVDANEGWAAGDEGLVLHTIDGGKTWERQPTGTRACLRDLHFVDAFTGFAVGREELPYQGGTAGVILFTDDGGVKWRVASQRELPGLQGLRFVDEQRAYMLAEGSDAQPSGLFASEDGGVSWKMVPGERRPGWVCGSFTTEGGVVAGAGGLMRLSRGQLLKCTTPAVPDATVRGVLLQDDQCWAVGEQGLVWSSKNKGLAWQAVDLRLPAGIQPMLDFTDLCRRGNSLWLTSRVGSVLVHSADGGQTWSLQPTGQNLPLHRVHFRDEKQGWAVGAAGLILATRDGGQTWEVQRRGAARAAVLAFCSRPERVPLGTIASLGGDEGYLVHVVNVGCPEDGPQAASRPHLECRLHEAVRRVGGCSAEMLPGFPLPPPLREVPAADLAAAWGGGDRNLGQDRLEERMVQAIRLWRPDVILTEAATASELADEAGVLLATAAKAACAKAGDASTSAEAMKHLALRPHQPLKLYGSMSTATSAQVTLDLENPRPTLTGSASDQTAAARPLLLPPTALPEQLAHYQLLWSSGDGAAHTQLLQGSSLQRGGQARRPAREVDPAEFEATSKHSQDKRELLRRVRALASAPQGAKLVIGFVEQGLPALDEEAGGEVAFLLAQQFAAMGQWTQAREVFLMLLDRYPGHALAPEACRWLLACNGSSLAKRRDELKQFDAAVAYHFAPPPNARKQLPTSAAGLASAAKRPSLTLVQRQRDRLREWHAGGLAAGELLAALSSQAFAEPRIQFGLQASHRALRQDDQAFLWYTQFLANQAGGPWFDAARAELWLGQPQGPCPKPLLTATRAEQPPVLDGRFTDACWLGQEPMALSDPTGNTKSPFATEVRAAQDDGFLYLAIHCRRPGARPIPEKKARQRDDDLAGQDRVFLLLDVDRHYATAARFEVDERGCAREDAWGDARWNPKWFIACETTPTSTMMELAIPLTELRATPLQPGETWACNVIRTIPGVGRLALGHPARTEGPLEGMGLLRFGEAPRK